MVFVRYHSFNVVPETQFSFKSHYNYPTNQIAKKIIRHKLSENTHIKPDDKELEDIISLTNDINIKKILYVNKNEYENIFFDYYKKSKEEKSLENKSLQDILKDDLKIAAYFSDIAQEKRTPQEFMRLVISLAQKQNLEKKMTHLLKNVISSSQFNGADLKPNNIIEIERFIDAINAHHIKETLSMSEETFKKLTKIFTIAEKVLKENKNPGLIYFSSLME